MSNDWRYSGFDYPKYKKCSITFLNVLDNKSRVFKFKIPPTGLSEQRSSNVSANKTASGWILFRSGDALGTLSVQGMLMDCSNAMERLSFIEMMSECASDTLNDYSEYSSPYKQSIDIEGQIYTGYISGYSLSKNSHPFMYQLNLSFNFYKSQIPSRVPLKTTNNSNGVSHGDEAYSHDINNILINGGGRY